MNRFESFLKMNNIFRAFSCIALITACASLGDAEIKEYSTINNAYTPNESAFKNQFKTDAPRPEDLFKFYCRGGKQLRPLSTKITAIVPTIKKGLDIGEAETLGEEALSALRDTVKKQYQVTRWSPRQPGHAGGVYYYATEFNKREDILQILKRPVLSMKLLEKDINFSTTLLSLGNSSSLILGIQAVPEFISGAANNPDEWGRSSQGDFFGEISKEPKKLKYEPLSRYYQPDRVMFSGKNYGDFFPIKPTTPFETFMFSNFYTMLIPKSVFLKVFERNSNGKGISDNYWTSRDEAFFYKDDGTFDLTKASGKYGREAVWRKYISTFTTVKEAQTADPQVINFEVSLGLDVFCAYARPINDLKAE